MTRRAVAPFPLLQPRGSTLIELPEIGVRRRGAFTLIELLVVVAIIAALIAILLPSLGKARDTAGLAVCGSNLRQQGVGIHAYANTYKGWLPSVETAYKPRNGVVSGSPNYAHDPFNLYYAARLNTDGTMRPNNHAQLYSLDMLPAPGVFYCPGLEDYGDDRWRLDHYEEPWLISGDNVGSFDIVRMNYQYLPEVNNNRIRIVDRVVKLTPQRIVAIDLLQVYEFQPHPSLNSWNVLRGDMSVQAAKSPEVVQIMVDEPGPLSGTNAWLRYNRLMEALLNVTAMGG